MTNLQLVRGFFCRPVGGLLSGLALLLCACQQQQTAPAPPVARADIPSEVTAYLQAFNAHSADQLAELMAPDIEVFYVDDNGHAALAASDRESMRSELQSYFQSFPDVTSTVKDSRVVQSGSFLAYTEEVSWTAVEPNASAARKTQASLTVLEHLDGKLRRAWYYPAARQPSP